MLLIHCPLWFESGSQASSQELFLDHYDYGSVIASIRLVPWFFVFSPNVSEHFRRDVASSVHTWYIPTLAGVATEPNSGLCKFVSVEMSPATARCHQCTTFFSFPARLPTFSCFFVCDVYLSLSMLLHISIRVSALGLCACTSFPRRGLAFWVKFLLKRQ